MLRRTTILSVVGACSVSALVFGQGRQTGLPLQSGAGADTPTVKIVKRDYDMAQLLKAPALADDVRKGRNVWLQRCAFCHDGLGTPTYNTLGPWLDSAVVAARGETAVRDKITKGSATMPGFQYGLRAAQINEVIAFLKTVSPAQKPTEAQRAGKAALPGGDL